MTNKREDNGQLCDQTRRQRMTLPDLGLPWLLLTWSKQPFDVTRCDSFVFDINSCPGHQVESLFAPLFDLVFRERNHAALKAIIRTLVTSLVFKLTGQQLHLDQKKKCLRAISEFLIGEGGWYR